MAEQHLDDPDIDAVFQQMRGKAVPQCVWTDAPGNLGGVGRLDDDAIELPGTDGLEGVLARKQPAITTQYPLAMAIMPPLAQQGEKVERGKGGRYRNAMLSPDLLTLLRQWWQVGHRQGVLHRDGWLFPGQHALKPISTRQLYRVVVEAAQAAEIARRVICRYFRDISVWDYSFSRSAS